MTFETFDPTKHTLEVGTRIRLAGREGEIILTGVGGGELGYRVEWEKLTHSYLDLSAYPLLEIAVSPLTIDKRVKGALVDIYNGPHDHETTLRMIYNYLNSLKET